MMEQEVNVHLQGFDDPLVGRLTSDDRNGSLKRLFGQTVAATIRSEGRAIVVNHEEQFDDPLVGYQLEFVEFDQGRKLDELFREPRKAKIAYSENGRELRISY